MGKRGGSGGALHRPSRATVFYGLRAMTNVVSHAAETSSLRTGERVCPSLSCQIPSGGCCF